MNDINETKDTKDTAAGKTGNEGRHELLADVVAAAIKANKICNMTQLAIHLKAIKKGQSVSGSFSKKLKALVPELQDLFDANNGNSDTTTPSSKPSTASKVKAVKPIKAVKSGKVAKAVKPVKAVKADKGSKSSNPDKTDKPDKSENPNGNPYRAYSSYGKLWEILFKNKDKGISRADLIKAGMTAIGKPERNTGFDVAVVVSPSQDGSAHRSANKAADKYWVERDGGLLKLHMR